MQLTQEQIDVLAHVVIDPQAWADHAEQTTGVQTVLDKVEKYRDEYLSASAAPEYLNRAQREQAGI